MIFRSPNDPKEIFISLKTGVLKKRMEDSIAVKFAVYFNQESYARSLTGYQIDLVSDPSQKRLRTTL